LTGFIFELGCSIEINQSWTPNTVRRSVGAAYKGALSYCTQGRMVSTPLKQMPSP